MTYDDWKADVRNEDGSAPNEPDSQPTMICPRCGAEHPDPDGFGFIAHTTPAYADGCGWCSHPSRDGGGNGGMVCGICGDVSEEG